MKRNKIKKIIIRKRCLFISFLPVRGTSLISFHLLVLQEFVPELCAIYMLHVVARYVCKTFLSILDSAFQNVIGLVKL